MTPQALDNLESGLFADLAAFRPELILCGTIIVLLLLRLLSALDRWHLGWVALAGTLAALYWSAQQWLDWSAGGYDKLFPGEMFTGLLVYDHFTIFLRL